MSLIKDGALFLLGKKKTRTGRWLGRCRKALRKVWIGAEARLRHGYRLTRKIAILTYKDVRRTTSVRRARDRNRARLRKLVERTGELRDERRARVAITRALRGRDAIILGPWVSEVGYEVLYWVPFVNWLVRQHKRIDRDRYVVMSRGGVASWYGDMGRRYVDVFDLISPEEFVAAGEALRQESGTHKQLGLSSLDHTLVDRAKEELGLRRARIVHPSSMYELFNHYWYGRRPFRVLWDHTRYEPQVAGEIDPSWGLPGRYAAVKFYSAVSMPDSAGNRGRLQNLVQQLAERIPVVLLDTGLMLDDHEDFAFEDNPNVVSARELMRPRDNLDVQTRIIGGAELYVGTCGSLAWLAPMLGVDTVALFADARFLHTHIRVALRVCDTLQQGVFSPMDLNGIDRLGLAVPAARRSAAEGSEAHGA